MHRELPATISMALAAIKWYFSNVKASDVQFPISTKRLRTIRRNSKGRGRGQVDGVTWADVERVCAFAEADNSVVGYRDSAMIRLMSDCLLRISEVVSVNVGHFKQNTLVVQRSKTDQEGTCEALYVTSDTRKAISSIVRKPILIVVLYSVRLGVTISNRVGSRMSLPDGLSRNGLWMPVLMGLYQGIPCVSVLRYPL